MPKQGSIVDLKMGIRMAKERVWGFGRSWATRGEEHKENQREYEILNRLLTSYRIIKSDLFDSFSPKSAVVMALLTPRTVSATASTPLARSS